MQPRLRNLLVCISVLLLATASVGHSQELALQRPPVKIGNHWYLPAREIAVWMGAAIEWNGKSRSVSMSYEGERCSWSATSGALVLREQHAFISARDLAKAFNLSANIRAGANIMEFGNDQRNDLIPLGWSLPKMPRGLTRDQRSIWQVLVRPGPEFAVRGIIDRPSRIRVVDRWAVAKVVPLNTYTDTAVAVLRKDNGTWRILDLGTAVGSDGSNYGIPAWARARLGGPF